MIPIVEWDTIKGQGWTGLVVGNGGSIALDQRFSYTSLYQEARRLGHLGAVEERFFDTFGTTDFEHVLRMLWYADVVNVVLGSPNAQISAEYHTVKQALIETVRAHHAEFGSIVAGLERVGRFMRDFETVASLNYDLTVYWAMLLENDNHAPGHWLKDCFRVGGGVGVFDTAWWNYRVPYNAPGATLVFYPHGQLALALDALGNERKLTVPTGAGVRANILAAIMSSWSSNARGYTPLFVSEGTSTQKLRSIRSSAYLSVVLDQVLPAMGQKIVIYGWSLGEHDSHIVEAIAKGQVTHVAASVYTHGPNAQADAAAIQTALLRHFPTNPPSVTFFRSDSPGCWCFP